MSQLHVLKIEISHGSDRHEISMYSNQPPTVIDLIKDLEKKTRIPMSTIQLIFKGQKLHLTPNVPLSKLGVFSGSRIVMIGEKLNPQQDAVFRRILGINKDVGLIENTLKDTQQEFDLMQQNLIDRTLTNELLPQMHLKLCSYKRDLDAFLRVINEINLDSNELSEIKKHQSNAIGTIKGNLDVCERMINQISKLINKN